MSQRTGWKIVHRTPDGERVSCMTALAVPSAAPSFHVRYRPRVWTYPEDRCGPLCVFTRREDATDYLRTLPTALEWELWSCRYVPSRSAMVWVRPWSSGGALRARLEWLAPGTALAHAVRLDLLERSVSA